MNYMYRQIELRKRYPLQISRGLISGSTNLYVLIDQEGFVGIGEAAPGSGAETAEICERQLQNFLEDQDIILSPVEAWEEARLSGVAMCAWAAVDVAIWDLLAQQSKRPLFQLLGLPQRSVPTSITIGIISPELVGERISEILNRTNAKNLKIKLGNPEGIEVDKAMYVEVQRAIENFDVSLRVDANGGWSLSDAINMIKWLADRECEYVEQPLKPEDDDQLPNLYRNRALPIFVDESCNFSSDVAKLAECVDGVNVKLMKCGGITEAVRIVSTARAHGLQTMIGCMGESSIAIAAGASIGSLFDHIDLDSHLNLDPDPADGLSLINGVVSVSGKFGHGANLVC